MVRINPTFRSQVFGAEEGSAKPVSAKIGHERGPTNYGQKQWVGGFEERPSTAPINRAPAQRLPEEGYPGQPGVKVLGGGRVQGHTVAGNKHTEFQDGYTPVNTEPPRQRPQSSYPSNPNNNSSFFNGQVIEPYYQAESDGSYPAGYQMPREEIAHTPNANNATFNSTVFAEMPVEKQSARKTSIDIVL